MSGWRSIGRWGLRIILGGLVLVMILAGIGWIWERSEEAAFRELAITPSGQMVPVGNHTLHVVASGRGATGVLLISGAGEGLQGWEKLQSRLSESTRVVSYDRPGFGWSPPREGDLTLDAAVEDVEGLLAAPDLFDGPPILIGHSLGGQIARHFAYAHPNAVAGLILLDAPPDEIKGLVKAEVTISRLISLLGSVGLLRWVYYRTNPGLARNDQLVQGHFRASASYGRALRRELTGLLHIRPVVVPPGGMGDLPLTFFLAKFDVPEFVRGAIDELNAEKRLIPQESTRGKLVELNSGHYVHLDHPDTVVAEVLRMISVVDSLRGSGIQSDARR